MRKGQTIIGPAFGTEYEITRTEATGSGKFVDIRTKDPAKRSRDGLGRDVEHWTEEGLRRSGYLLASEAKGANR